MWVWVWVRVWVWVGVAGVRVCGWKGMRDGLGGG